MYTYNIFNDLFLPHILMENYFPARGVSAGKYPLVSISDNRDSLSVSAVVPGLTPEDITIELHNENLVISGEKKNDRSDTHHIRTERHFGRFTRTVKLPYRVNPETIKARMEKGILHISMEKSEDAKPRRIAIQ